LIHLKNFSEKFGENEGKLYQQTGQIYPHEKPIKISRNKKT
jgi:hypothetical protein